MSSHNPYRHHLRYIYILLAVIVCVAALIMLSDYRNGNDSSADEVFGDIVRGKRSRGAGYYAAGERKVETFRFDPNEADSSQLLRLGLAPFQVRSIYRFRAKGGVFSTADDFRRVYRLTNEQWERLAPYIVIGRKYQLVSVPPRTYPKSDSVYGNSRGRDSADIVRDSIRRTYPQKISGDETVDVNTADSAMLCRIPGIGKYYASRIVRYRNRLGGFVSPQQLLEIEDFPADALAWITVGPSPVINRMDVNHLSERKMMKHPYMGYYRASEIAAYRKVHGRLDNIKALYGLQHFSESDIQRLAPYLEFR